MKHNRKLVELKFLKRHIYIFTIGDFKASLKLKETEVLKSVRVEQI